MTLEEAGRKGGKRGKGSAKARPHDFYTKILPAARRRANITHQPKLPWGKVDWSMHDSQIARKIRAGVSTVRNKRHALGLPPCGRKDKPAA